MLYYFLLCSKVNQLYMYVYPLSLGLLSHRSILWSFAIELEWSQTQFHPLSSVEPFTSVAPAVSGTPSTPSSVCFPLG